MKVRARQDYRTCGYSNHAIRATGRDEPNANAIELGAKPYSAKMCRKLNQQNRHQGFERFRTPKHEWLLKCQEESDSALSRFKRNTTTEIAEQRLITQSDVDDNYRFGCNNESGRRAKTVLGELNMVSTHL